MDMTCKCCDSVSSNQSRCFCWATIPWTSWLRPARGTIKTIVKPWQAKAGQNYVLQLITIQHFAKHVWNWGGVTRPPTNSIVQPISVCSFWMRLLRSDWSTMMINWVSAASLGQPKCDRTNFSLAARNFCRKWKSWKSQTISTLLDQSHCCPPSIASNFLASS